MNRRLLLAAVFACLALPISISASDLSRVVQAMENDLGVHHTRIPMLGMAMNTRTAARHRSVSAAKSGGVFSRDVVLQLLNGHFLLRDDPLY